MDKVKNLFRILKRIHFWLLCVLLLASGLVAWMMSVNNLDSKRDARVSAINTLYQNVIGVASKTPHPNEDVKEGMTALLDQTKIEIREAWSEKFAQQTEILQWPKELENRFKRVVEKLRPIEKEVPFPLPQEKEELRIGDRENYNTVYIKRQLPRLAKSIGARWVASMEGGGQMGGMMGGYGEEMGMAAPMEMEGGGLDPNGNPTAEVDRMIVRWSPENQQELFQNHFQWNQANTGEISEADAQPDTLEILYAQEDIWVLQALLNIIKRTNGDANARHNAAIKSIDYLRIGVQASKSSGRITRLGGEGGDMMGGEMGGGEFGGEMGGGEFGGEMGGGESGGEMGGRGFGEFGEGMGGPAMKDPCEGRYVDAEYRPLSAEKLRSVMTSSEAIAPEDAYLAVAKRMPVRMRLSMDQRAIHKLLVECANNELVLEVRQVRVNPEKDDANSMSGGFGGMGGEMGYGEEMGMGGGMGMGGEMGMGRETGGGFAPKKKAKVEKASTNKSFPFDVPVEIYGIIYIYNPVDEAILGNQDGEETAEEPLAASL